MTEEIKTQDTANATSDENPTLSEASKTEDNTVARIQELETLLSEKNKEILDLHHTIGEVRTELNGVRAEISATLEGYRVLLMSQHPEITPEMISGENISTINDSLAKARNIMAKIKQSVLKELARSRIPAGASGRQGADLTTLSPREKIKYGIGGKQ